jgi:DNA-binding MarR family transcriptional regulator
MTAKQKQRPEELMAQECLIVRLRMLNRVVTNIYDDALRSLGMKASQLNVLVVAAMRGPIRPAEICECLQLDASTLSRNVERMKAKGWLEVVPEEDGRAQPIQLTTQGRRLLQQAMPAWEQAQEAVREMLGEDVSNVVRQAVSRLDCGDPAA